MQDSNQQDQDRAVSFIAYIEKQRRRFLSNLRAVLSAGEVEAVHDVRVASRRLAEPLRIASGVLGRKRVGRAAELLNDARRALREVRDFDVILESLCDDSCAPGLDAQDMARLEGELTHQRDRAIAKSQRACERQKPQQAGRIIREIASELADVLGGKGASAVESELERLYSKSLRQVHVRDPRESKGGDLHRTRILLKRLRYSVELMRDVCGRDFSELHQSLVGMQDQLGFWNDQLCAVRRISKIARRQRILAEDTGWAARLLEHCAQRLRAAEHARTNAIEQWDSFASCLRRHELNDEPAYTAEFPVDVARHSAS